ncbi:hypothetical protein Hdeb2414_s0007g00246351 [Helianthus debilis subsp. tardiflorus]
METMDAPVPEVRNESKPTRMEEVGQNLSASAIGDTMEPLMLGLYFIELLCTLCLSLKEIRGALFVHKHICFILLIKISAYLLVLCF